MRWALYLCSGVPEAWRSGCHCRDFFLYAFLSSAGEQRGDSNPRSSWGRRDALARSAWAFDRHVRAFPTSSVSSARLSQASAALACSRSFASHSALLSAATGYFASPPASRQACNNAFLAARNWPRAIKLLARLCCNVATLWLFGYLASFFGSLANSAKAWSYESNANACSPSLHKRFARAARAQNNNPGSLKTFSVRVQRILEAQSAAVWPSSSTASNLALHFDTRKRASSDRLCLAAAWRGVAPPKRVDVAFALAPRVTSSFATASWPATMAACKAGTSVAGAATTGHSGMASTSQQARSAFAPKSSNCCATRAWPPTAALATPKLRTLSPASLSDSRASVKARSGARPDAAASTTCAGGENFRADATRKAAACVRRFLSLSARWAATAASSGGAAVSGSSSSSSSGVSEASDFVGDGGGETFARSRSATAFAAFHFPCSTSPARLMGFSSTLTPDSCARRSANSLSSARMAWKKGFIHA